MSKKIEVKIPGFGKRYCDDNVKFKFDRYNEFFYFYYLEENNDEEIYHNSYGPAKENIYGGYEYYIHNLYHRLDGPAIYNKAPKYKSYWINGKFIGTTKKEFIEYKNKYLIQG